MFLDGQIDDGFKEVCSDDVVVFDCLKSGDHKHSSITKCPWHHYALHVHVPGNVVANILNHLWRLFGLFMIKTHFNLPCCIINGEIKFWGCLNHVSKSTTYRYQFDFLSINLKWSRFYWNFLNLCDCEGSDDFRCKLSLWFGLSLLVWWSEASLFHFCKFWI